MAVKGLIKQFSFFANAADQFVRNSIIFTATKNSY